MAKFGLFIIGLMYFPLALAQPEFSLPINCVPNKNCWIVNYADHGHGKAIKDYQCRWRSYDGHRGTDFAILNTQLMGKGVDVIAAAPGVVVATRDGMEDKYWKKSEDAKLKGKYCGNRVAIKHDETWYTDYCHLRRGSIRVKTGDIVSRGQVLGLVGLSGKTEFPHVHFGVYKNKKIIDPFTNTEVLITDCSVNNGSLWTLETQQQLRYHPTQISTIGFSSSRPEYQDIKKGWYHHTLLPSTSPVLGLWTTIIGINKDDKLKIELINPDGKKILSHSKVILKNQVMRFEFIGRRRSQTPWVPGVYEAIVEIKPKDSNQLPIKKTQQLIIQGE